jgi:hypothetical protein
MVSELIDTATGTWNNARIVQHFLPVDVLTILSIPLREQTDDFVGMAFCFKRHFFNQVTLEGAYRDGEKQIELKTRVMWPLKLQVIKNLWEVQVPT